MVKLAMEDDLMIDLDNEIAELARQESERLGKGQQLYAKIKKNSKYYYQNPESVTVSGQPQRHRGLRANLPAPRG